MENYHCSMGKSTISMANFQVRKPWNDRENLCPGKTPGWLRPDGFPIVRWSTFKSPCFRLWLVAMIRLMISMAWTTTFLLIFSHIWWLMAGAFLGVAPNHLWKHGIFHWNFHAGLWRISHLWKHKNAWGDFRTKSLVFTQNRGIHHQTLAGVFWGYHLGRF